MAILRTVMAARPSDPHALGDLPPILCHLFGPGILPPLARIAPGEIVDMPALVILTGENIPAIPIIMNLLVLAVAQIPKLSRPGNIDVLGSTDGDRLQPFVSHDRANPSRGAGVGVFDGRHEYPVFASQADSRH